jgi:hypothetical protein
VWSCNRPGQTPLEQPPLVELRARHEAPVLFTVTEWPVELGALVPVAKEFERHRLEIHVVWQMRQAPSEEMLGAFSGKLFRQYWDPEGRTGGAARYLQVRGQPVPLEAVALRVALAREALRR